MEIIDKIIEKKLTPNQFYVLVSIRDKVSPLYINLHQELRTLLSEEWLTKTEAGNMELSSNAIELLNEVESLFKVQKKKTNNTIMGAEYSENIEKYTLLFPKIRIPTSKLPARSAEKNVEVVFKWFFLNYKYSWDVVLKATAMYVDELQTKNYAYMRTSQYFIKKQEQDKTITSKLADYCSIVESGDDLDTGFHFKEKVY
jgi:hypothetical protein